MSKPQKMISNRQRYSGRIFPRAIARYSRGAVLVVMLISITLLVGLVFFVYNYGDHVSSRLEMQNTADSAAISGAGWVARSMNVVAMNNIGQSKLLSLVVTLDALPLGTDMSLIETRAMEAAITDQLPRLRNENLGGTKLKTMIIGGLESLQRRVAAERIILEAMDEQLNHSSFEMSSITHWRDGKLWEAIYALDEFSTATLLSVGQLTQDISSDVGQANNADIAFVIPIVPQIPHRAGEFADFKPTLEGSIIVTSTNATDYSVKDGLGGVIPDGNYPYRLGPWAKLHHWWWSVRAGGKLVRRPGSQVRSVSGGPSGGGAGTSAVTQSAGWDWNPPPRVIGYSPFGFYHWAIAMIDKWAEINVPDISFASHVHNIANIKLDYMFGDRPVTLQKVHYPEFIIDYLTIRNKMNARPPSVSVYRTHFFLVEVVSSLPPSNSNWLSAGVARSNAHDPITVKLHGWSDPATWNGFTQVGNYVWRGDFEYEVTEDRGLGLLPKHEDPDDPSSPLVWHKVYRTQFYIFAGADIGTTTTVSNPCSYDGLDGLPAPYLLDTEAQDYTIYRDEGMRRDMFTYLGVATRSRTSRVWGQRFVTGNPSGMITTIAQVEIFNNKSWDLWTQDWQAKLVPVTNWSDWIDKFDEGIGQADFAEGRLDATELQIIRDYLDSIDPDFAETFLNH